MNRDSQYVEALRAYYGKHGVLPSFAAIGRLVGMSSKASVAEMVARLKRRRYLESTPDGRLRPGPRFHERLVAGSPVRAGWPNAGQEAQPETLSLDTFLIGDLRNTVLLPVKGDSMIDVGIRDGDVVVVARRTDAHNGQIVVALVEGEPTLKRLAFERGQPVLRAENSAYATIRPKGGLEIFGVVVGLARRYR